LWSEKKWREKLVPGKNVPFHRLKFVLPWRNKRKIKSWIEAEDPSSSQHCQKVYDKDGNPPQSQKIRT
jgi:hypothetical protein